MLDKEALNVHLGQIIKEFRKETGLSMAEFADLAKISKAYVSVLEKNKNPRNGNPIIPSIPTIRNVANGVGLTFDEVFSLLDESQIVSLQDDSKITPTLLDLITATSSKLEENRQDNVLEYAEQQLNEQNHIVKEDNLIYIQRGHASAAGSAIYGDDSEVSMDVLPSSMVPNGADELVVITGDSMEPLIKKGSEVYIRHQPVVENGEIAIVKIEDDGVTCKRFYLTDDNIILKSINEEYKDIVLPKEQIQVIGKVLI